MTPISDNDSANIKVTLATSTRIVMIYRMIHLKTPGENTSNETHHVDDEEYMKRLRRLKMAWQEGLYTDEEFKIEREN